MTLVRVGDRGVHEHPPVAEAVPAPELGGVGAVSGGRYVDAVRHHDDPVPLDAEGVDHGVGDERARHGHDVGARHRSRHLTFEVAAPDRREVLRQVAVLQVVHRQHDGP